MDRNEKKNSFRNVQNSRGNDREAKKYKRAFHITLAVAVVLAASTGGLGFTTYQLYQDGGQNQEGEGGQSTGAQTTQEAENATGTSDSAVVVETETPAPTKAPEGTTTPDASVTPTPGAENNAQTVKLKVTNSLGFDINTIDIREAGIYEDDSKGWKSGLWDGTSTLTAGGSEEYSVKLDELEGDNFDIRINGDNEAERKNFRNLPLKDIIEINLKLADVPFAEYNYKDKDGKIQSYNTYEDAKKVNADNDSNDTENDTETSDQN